VTIVLANDGDGGRLALRGINKQPSRVREQVEREGMDEESKIAARYARVAGHLDERGRRAVAATEAGTIGWGGITLVSRPRVSQGR
jgi:hypothetical protein